MIMISFYFSLCLSLSVSLTPRADGISLSKSKFSAFFHCSMAMHPICGVFVNIYTFFKFKYRPPHTHILLQCESYAELICLTKHISAVFPR